MAENQNNAQQPDPRWPGRTAEEAAVLESIARSAGRKWAEENVDVILAQAQAAADAAWSPGLKKAVRRILAALAVVIAAAVIILWFVTDDPSAELTRMNVGRVKPRMTLEEVTLILGPPGDHRMGNTQPDPNDYGFNYPISFHPSEDVIDSWKIPRSQNPKRVVWRTDSADLTVLFNYSGQAYTWTYMPMWIPNETAWDKLSRNVKRHWQRLFR
jgi:hypothetical protein